MPDPVNPGNQPPNPGNQPPKLTFNDIVDADAIRQQMSQLFSESFTNASRTAEQLFGKTFDRISKNASESFNSAFRQVNNTSDKAGKDISGNFETASKDVRSTFDKTGRAITDTFDQSNKNISEAFSKTGKNITGTFDTTFAQAQTVEQRYIAYTSSAERNKLRMMMQERDKLIKHVRGQGEAEAKYIKFSEKDKKKQQERLAENEITIAGKVADIHKAKNVEIARARLQAIASEATFTGSVVRAQENIKEGAKSWATSVLHARSAWEAIVALITAASSRSMSIAETVGAVRQANVPAVRTQEQVQGLRGATGIEEMGGKLVMTEKQMDQFLQTLSSAPNAFKQARQDGGEALNKLTGAMGYFGVSAEDTMQMVVDASNKYNMSQRDLLLTFERARGVSRLTNINFKDVFTSMMKMSGSLRSLTFNSKEAATDIASMITVLTGKKGLGYSADEAKKFGESIASFLGNLSPSKLAGMAAFTTGEMPTTGKELEKAGSPEAYLKFMKPLIEGSENEAQKLFKIQSLAGQGFGPGEAATNLKAAQALLAVIEKAGDIGQTFNEIRKNSPEQQFKELQEEGFKTLADKNGPLQTLESTVIKFFEAWSRSAIPVLQQLPRFFQFIQTALSPEQLKSYGLIGKNLANEANYQMGTAMMNSTNLDRDSRRRLDRGGK